MTGWGTWNLWGLASGSQGFQTNAKDDTLYYGVSATGAIADLATDLGQYAVNQTVQRAWHYEAAPATRFNLVDSWCFEFDADCDNADTGRFFQYDCATAASDLSLAIGAGGVITAIINNAAVATTITLPGISGSNQRYIIGWAAAPNPYTTGAADALRHVIYAWNRTAGTYTQAVFSTVVRPAQTGTMVIWAASTAGSSTFAGSPRGVRISTGRWHGPVETRQDFVAATTPPTFELATRVEFPIVDPACGLADPGQLAGPVYFMGAQSAKQNAFRTFSPIVNEQYLNRTSITAATYAEVPTQYRLAEPDSALTLMTPWMFYRPVPPSATHVRVRVFVKQWNTSHSGLLTVRCYSFNRPPRSAAIVDQGVSMVAHYGEATCINDHGSGGTDGEWLDLGLIAPAVNSAGCTWLCFGFDTLGDPGTTEFEVGAIVVEPGVVE